MVFSDVWQGKDLVTDEGSSKERRKRNLTQRRPDRVGVNAERRGYAEKRVLEQNRKSTWRNGLKSRGHSAGAGSFGRDGVENSRLTIAYIIIFVNYKIR